MSDLDDRAAKLKKRNARIEEGLAFSQITKDVFAKRIVRQGRKPSGAVYDAFTVHRTNGAGSQEHASSYLPQGCREPIEEYQKRLSLTPFLPESPGVLNGRRGALFENEPKFTGPGPVMDFIQKATARGEPLMTVIGRVHERMEIAGWCGLFIHRLPSPGWATALSEAGQLSQAVVEEAGLDDPVVTLYRDSQILDYAFDGHGLVWVRVLEGYTGLVEAGKTVEVVREINKHFSTTYTIHSKNNAVTNIEEESISHGATIDGEAVIPFVFASSPLQIEADDVDPQDPVAFPVLHAASVCDVAATRLMSDVRWCMFVLGQPLLTFKHSRSDKELTNIETGPTRYFALRAGKGDLEGEELAYVVLDSTGIELQIAALENDHKRAKELGGKGGDAALQVPVTESGVSRAWRFKTGEEQLLFLLTGKLQATFDRVLDIVAGYHGISSEKVSVQFHVDFSEDAKPEDVVELEEAGQKVWTRYRLKTAIRLSVRRMFARLYPQATAEEKAEFEREIEAALAEVKKAPDPQPDKGNDDDDDVDEA